MSYISIHLLIIKIEDTQTISLVLFLSYSMNSIVDWRQLSVVHSREKEWMRLLHLWTLFL